MKFLLLLTLLFSIGYILNADEGCESPGTVERPSYYADAIDTRMVYSIYLPPCYAEADTDYPVIYLMHGSNEDDGQWQRLGLVDRLDERILSGEMPPVIVVMPFGNWIANENRFDEASWNHVFLSQLVPLVEESFRIRANREFRAIGGISRGGFWAYQIAFRNTALFSAVGGHSAFFDRYHAPPEYNPLNLATEAVNIDSLRIFLDRGRDDYAAPGLDLMNERLEERGVRFTYIVHDEGQHHNSYWSQHIDEYIDFYVRSWREPSADLGIISTPTAEHPSNTPNTDVIEIKGNVTVFLPVVAFPSLQYEIASDRLQSIRLGLLDDKLILDATTAAALAAYDIPLPEGIHVVSDDELFNRLWRDRTLFTLRSIDHLQLRYRILNVDGENLLTTDLEEYPLVFESDSANYNPSLTTTIIMSGVTALTRDMIPVLDENGVEWAAEGIREYVQSVDYFHISNEVSLYPTCPETDGPLYGGSLSFCSKESHFDLLKLLDVDVVELSGNHNNDYGYQAYLDTLQWYETNGIMTIGGGETILEAQEPLLLQHNGNTIAMLSCNWIGPYYALVSEDENATGGVRPGAAMCDRAWLADVVPVLAAENDVVIVSVQYLEADQYTPTATQQRDFRYLVELGADVVIGTQAHFPQTFEFVTQPSGEESFIHYGLGNLYFDQRFFAGVRFFMDQLIINDGKLVSIDLFPGIIEDQGRPRAMTPDERENFFYLMFIEHGGF